MSTYKLLVADECGVLYEHPVFLAASVSPVRAVIENAIPAPYGTMFVSLPGWTAMGFDPHTNSFEAVDEIRVGKNWKRVCAVAAVPPPGYMRLSLPAAERSRNAPPLPPWAYSSMGVGGQGKRFISAVRVDARRRWDAVNYETGRLLPGIKAMKERFPHNRLISQLAVCATDYFCSTARNLFLGRFEAALPLARTCNSRCIACISRRHGSHPCSQERIKFKPSLDEAVEIAIHHMKTAWDPIVSFGQGCEGEPLTEAGLITSIISETRKHTGRGIFNLNTNGSMPEKISGLASAGLGSVRVSLNSADMENYNLYSRPKGYTFNDVMKFIRESSESGIFTNVNLLVFPGATDTPSEMIKLIDLCRKCGVDFIQLRNLCVDPSIYPPEGFIADGRPMGMKIWLELIRKELPDTGFGCFNSTVAEIKKTVR